MRKNKIVSAMEAISAIKDGSVLAAAGFVGNGTPEELLISLEKCFLEAGKPKNLTLLFSSGLGDARDRGLNRLAHPGLLKRVIAGHYGLMPKIGRMALDNKFEAYNLPQGILTNFYRAVAARRPGVFSKVGLGTFVDPRLEGGKVNTCTTEDLLEVVSFHGEDYLFMRSFPIQVAIIRGTTADTMGNISMEKEILTLDALDMATAVHNCGGIVIAQVERLANHGSINSRAVKIPGILVDFVVVAKPENHMQTYATPYNPSYSGEIRVPTTSLIPLELTERKIIARRAAMELRPYNVVNLGIGVPEGVATVANEEKILNSLTLTVEPGIIGGIPVGGLDFGASVNAEAVIGMPDQFNFYDGGGLDLACLGMAQTDMFGNVNSSCFGNRLAGCGGFINISQNAKTTIFVGSMTAGNLEVAIKNGKLEIIREGDTKKFVKKVGQITFSGNYGSLSGQKILYVTERCVFELRNSSLHLIEVAHGIDIKRDIICQMEFEPVIDNPKFMDFRIFQSRPMGIRSELLRLDIDSRLTFHEPTQTLHVNFRGLEIECEEDILLIREVVEKRCRALGKLVAAHVNYDFFKCADDVLATYCDMVEYIVSTYYTDVSRYSLGSNLKALGEEFERRKIETSRFKAGILIEKCNANLMFEA
ncbi:MAG: acyl CoA:acetate/3-ketoacid CoA transferase [Candidatus Riflebacteria bacterium]|nr:acyl CoA:acetate/3-ketoacid CoA transferase [Candidatus Riflebacteria bacterium]